MSDPSAFGPARERLWKEIVQVNDAWAQFQYLYGESTERLRVLNGCAGWFFALTQRALLREVILGISRLTDPVQSGKFDNLVIGSLLLDPAVDQHPGLRAELEAAVRAAALQLTGASSMEVITVGRLGSSLPAVTLGRLVRRRPHLNSALGVTRH